MRRSKLHIIGAFALLVVAGLYLTQATLAGSVPNTSLKTHPSSSDGQSGWFKTVPKITLTSDDATAVTYYSWDNPDPKQIYKYAIKAPEGKHTLYYYSGTGGGVDEPIKQQVFRVDSRRPSFIIKAPKHRKHVRGPLRIKVRAYDPDVSTQSSGLNEIRLYMGSRLLAKKKASVYTFKVKTRYIKAGKRRFRVLVRDKAGNKRGRSRHYYIDNKKPVIRTVSVQPSVPTVQSRGGIFVKLVDRVSRRIYVTVQIRKTDGTLVRRSKRRRLSRKKLVFLGMKMPDDEGNYIYRIIARDYAGNRQVKIVKFRVENPWKLENVKAHLFEISKVIGVRDEGTAAEHRTADYIEGQLRAFGYATERQAFTLSNGRTSYNVIARKTGTDPGQSFVIGAHYDSQPPSPGANDNGTGSSVLLELARSMKSKRIRPTLTFVWFGAEERIRGVRGNEHFGSRHFVSLLSPTQRQQTIGMISVDMVGVGQTFHVRSTKRGPMTLVDDILNFAGQNGHAVNYTQDLGASDHLDFELAGIPSAWLEWRVDNLFHTTADNYERIQWDAVDITGHFLSTYLLNRLGG